LINSGMDRNGVFTIRWTYFGPAGCDDVYNVRWGIVGAGQNQEEVHQRCSPADRPPSECHDGKGVNPGVPWSIAVQACHTRFLQTSECSQWSSFTILPFGPDTCIFGFVWREVVPSDHVCVSPQERDTVRADNGQAAARRSPHGGPFGADTCIQGFVWREATGPGDHVCVTLQQRQQARDDNAHAAERRTDGKTVH
jgi:hypothetical protein